MSVILKKPWATQPQFPVGIDKSNLLSRGLVFACVPANGTVYDAVSGMVGTVATAANPVYRTGIDGNFTPTLGTVGNYTFPIGASGLDALVGVCSMFAEGSLFTNASVGFCARSRSPTTGDAIGIGFDDAAFVTNSFLAYCQNNNVSASQGDCLGLDAELYNHRVMATFDGANCRGYAKNGLNKTVGNTDLPLARADRQTTVNVTPCLTTVVLAWNRVLTLSEYQQLYANPWQVFAPRQRRIFAPAAAGGAVTGTVAYTNANDTSAASGTTTVLGTLAKTNANDTLSASGTTTVLGTLAKTNANDTSVASGTTAVIGTLAYTNANDTVVAAGSGGNPVGAVAYTNANDSCVASGVAQSAVTTSGGKKARARAKQKRIAHEQRIAKETQDILAKPPAPIVPKTARATVVTAPVSVAPKLAAIARTAVESSVATAAAVKAPAAIAAPATRDLAAEVDFKMQYWARFLVLVIDNLHSH